jgi:hypothetical protein
MKNIKKDIHNNVYVEISRTLFIILIGPCMMGELMPLVFHAGYQ